MQKNLSFSVNVANGTVNDKQFVYLSTLDTTAELNILLKNYVHSDTDSFEIVFNSQDNSIFKYQIENYDSSLNLLSFTIPSDVLKHSGITRIQLILKNSSTNQVLATLISSVNVVRSLLDNLDTTQQQIAINDFENWKAKIEDEYGNLDSIIKNAETAINQEINNLLLDPNKLPILTQLKGDVDSLKTYVDEQLNLKQDKMQYISNVRKVDGFADVPLFLSQNGYYRTDKNADGTGFYYFNPKNSDTTYRKAIELQQKTNENGSPVLNQVVNDNWHMILLSQEL